MKSISTSLLAIGLAASTAMADNTFYAPGDLVLYFQKEGSTNTVYANLGNAATQFRGTAAGSSDGVNHVNFLDLNATLTTAFGGGWATDPTVYAGLAGVNSSSSSSVTLINGDPSRTIYISSARESVGTVGTANSEARNILGDTAMTDAATHIGTQNNIFDVNYNVAQTVSPTSLSQIDDQNPITVTDIGTIQGPAFNNFASGVQQTGTAATFGSFGAAGTVKFALDLYRILARTDISGQVGGVRRTGSYEGTVTVNGGGMVSFIAQGAAASSYSTWMGGFPSITAPADQLASADPDGDGLSNLMEFVLDGNPGIADNPSVVPALTTTSTDFVFSFNRRDDSEANNTLLFQYGSDLTGWTDVAIGAAGGTVGSATVAITENTTDPDAITVTVPKTAAVGNKLFGRLKVTNP
ncbi:MAG: hypothetical protein ABI162_03240 [Luteolibacter sp.]